jgi:hypothetical protein
MAHPMAPSTTIDGVLKGFDTGKLPVPLESNERPTPTFILQLNKGLIEAALKVRSSIGQDYGALYLVVTEETFKVLLPNATYPQRAKKPPSRPDLTGQTTQIQINSTTSDWVLESAEFNQEVVNEAALYKVFCDLVPAAFRQTHYKEGIGYTGVPFLTVIETFRKTYGALQRRTELENDQKLSAAWPPDQTVEGLFARNRQIASDSKLTANPITDLKNTNITYTVIEDLGFLSKGLKAFDARDEKD